MTAIKLSVEDGIAELVLANPKRRNSLDEEFWGSLAESLSEIAADSRVRAVVLTGEGDHFSSGIDLDFVAGVLATDSVDAGRARDRVYHNIHRLQDTFLELERCRVPVVAAVHGACIGAGLELACTADIRVCSSEAFFQLMEVQVGLVADLGGLQRLARQLPMGVARELAYTGRRFTADEALGWGFVNRVCPSPEDARVAARGVAGQIAAHSPLAVRYIKEALVAEDIPDIEHGMRRAAMANTAFGQDVAGALEAVRKGQAADFPNLDCRPTARD